MNNCYFCFVVELDSPLWLQRQQQQQSIFSSLKFFCRNKKRTVFFFSVGGVCFGQVVCQEVNWVKWRVTSLDVSGVVSFDWPYHERCARDGFALLWLVTTLWLEKCPRAQALKSGRQKATKTSPLKITKWIQNEISTYPLAGYCHRDFSCCWFIYAKITAFYLLSFKKCSYRISKMNSNEI